MRYRSIFFVLILCVLATDAIAWNCNSCCYAAYMDRASVAYTRSFSTSYVTDSGYYVLCPGCVMSISGIGSYYFHCHNGDFARYAYLIAYTYNGSTKLAQTYNGANIANYQRSDVLSSSCGAEITYYPASGVSSSSMGVYTFSNRGTYQVYVDFMNSFCYSTSCSTFTYFACRRAGGPGDCHVGWYPQNTYNILVPNPIIDIDKPSNQPDAPPSVVLSWDIENDGVGKETIRISRNCGNWTCAFVGYTENSPVTLNEGASYTVLMNITVPPAGSKNVGITVSYDDGYGLSCISAKSASSLVNVTASSCPNITIDVEAPAEVLTPTGSAILMGWNVTNNCDADLVLNFSRACDTWNCSFVGYNEGDNVTLSKGAVYPVRMAVDYSVIDYYKNVGIKITYADLNPLCAGASENSSYVYVSIPHIF